MNLDINLPDNATRARISELSAVPQESEVLACGQKCSQYLGETYDRTQFYTGSRTKVIKIAPTPETDTTHSYTHDMDHLSPSKELEAKYVSALLWGKIHETAHNLKSAKELETADSRLPSIYELKSLLIQHGINNSKTGGNKCISSTLARNINFVYCLDFSNAQILIQPVKDYCSVILVSERKK